MAAVVQLVAPVVNEDALRLVEGALERVMCGDTVDVAIVEVSRRKTVANGFSGGGSYHLLNSGAARLAARLANLED